MGLQGRCQHRLLAVPRVPHRRGHSAWCTGQEQVGSFSELSSPLPGCVDRQLMSNEVREPQWLLFLVGAGDVLFMSNPQQGSRSWGHSPAGASFHSVVALV